MAPIRINLIATPRSMSTPLMYSFASRTDCKVVDEPLYAYHLARHPELQRPYREELFKSQSTNAADVIRDIILGPCDKPVLFLKQIAKQFEQLDTSFMAECFNLFLVRSPVDMVAKFDKNAPASVEETGLTNMLPLLHLCQQKEYKHAVLDADLLQSDPEGMLKSVCLEIGIEFQAEMMSWPAGPKPYDGVWAYYWYTSLHKSTGFEALSSKLPSVVPAKLRGLVSLVFPMYQAIRTLALGAKLPLHSVQAGHISDHGLSLPALPDKRNADVLVWVGSQLVPREYAAVSVFDSAVQGGDAVWEGLRVYDGRIFNLEPHLQRLQDSAKAMAFADIPSIDFIKNAVFRTLAANGMRDGVHMRLTLSRGEKTTSSMNPSFNVYGSKLLIVPEWKPVEGAATYDNSKGVTLITASNRRNPPQCVDSKIHHTNLINNILPKIQANLAGAADAIMLDTEGFVSETNATNLFIVKHGVLLTPHADFCLPGTTRRTVMDIAVALEIPLVERRISLSEFHSADECFTTGTMGELTPVVCIDGRTIGDGVRGSVTERIQSEYKERTKTGGTPIPEF
eukprot:m.172963 g.172963  ORF g.172963 m.172963 type:complete len:566 (+) comp21289_c0_seq6:2045-3742(+)